MIVQVDLIINRRCFCRRRHRHLYPLLQTPSDVGADRHIELPLSWRVQRWRSTIFSSVNGRHLHAA
ncbi:uncharacterized protein DS421_6g196420 [Arachis hypogaea]|nr:uncharacterized protein DS421_6g196420 [Arachis hypogaea]